MSTPTSTVKFEMPDGLYSYQIFKITLSILSENMKH